MYLPIDTQPSCAQAWLAAARAVNGRAGHDANNVIIDVENPIAESSADSQIRAEVESLLRRHNHWPLKTVSNTIFPNALYARHGAPAFYDAYLKKVFPRIKRTHGDWGRYFERMISFPLLKKGETINPLKDLVEKVRKHAKSERCFRNVYELTIYDPIRDAGPVMNRQCLSFLSFKLVDGTPHKLLLTAVYRNHYYVERLLGNLEGLGHLMHFIAQEANVVVGSLTVISTHAEVDNAAPRDEIDALLMTCAEIVKKASKSRG